MALRTLPTQLPTRGKLHHHSKASSSNCSLSWCRSLTPLPLLFSSTNSPGKVCTQQMVVKCSSGSGTVQAVNMGPGTPVRPTSILVVGATGTLGRQIVRRALDEGYDVRCLVRPRPAPADFLRDWGATVVNADLSKPETIPATLVGVHTIIDCATGRPEEPIKKVDWEGKVALIQCAKAMGIQKYVFYSIHNCDKHPEVPLMEIKYCTEQFLQDSGLPHVIIRLCGFMQGLIGQYAVPILEEKSVWGTDAPTRIAYMDTQDVARLTFIALRNEKINGRTLTFAGPRAWTTQEVITLCERLAAQDANVTTVPVSVLRFTRQLTRFFEWTNDVADRLAFSEVLTSDTVFSVPMNETYNLLGVCFKSFSLMAAASASVSIIISPRKLRSDVYSYSYQNDSNTPLVISVLASLIERTMARNERIARNCKWTALSKKDSRTRVFDCHEIPDMTIQSYLERIFRYTRAGPSVYVVAYVYIDRFCQANPGFRIHARNVHRLLITTIMVASKYVEDMNYRNSYFARVGGLETNELNKLELDFLFLMGFKMHVNVRVFESYCCHLEREVSIGGGYHIERTLRCAGEIKSRQIEDRRFNQITRITL